VNRPDGGRTCPSHRLPVVPCSSIPILVEVVQYSTLPPAPHIVQRTRTTHSSIPRPVYASSQSQWTPGAIPHPQLEVTLHSTLTRSLHVTAPATLVHVIRYLRCAAEHYPQTPTQYTYQVPTPGKPRVQSFSAVITTTTVINQESLPNYLRVPT